MNLTVQHLSDEAIAACADGVLPAGARSRAERHLQSCADCADAVHGQREAMRALRSATAPSLPHDLLDRLRSLPMTTPLRATPVVLGEGGAPMFAAFGTNPPVPPVPPARDRAHRGRFGGRSMMLVGATTVLAVGFVSASVGPVSAQSTQHTPAQRGAATPTPAPAAFPTPSSSAAPSEAPVLVRHAEPGSQRAVNLLSPVGVLPGSR